MEVSVRQSPSTGRPISSSSLKSQLLHVPHHSSDALSSSALDFLLEMHLRREREQQQTDTSTTSAQKMTTKERTMIQEGCRKERTAILDEAFKLLDEDC
jgi:hypothetical protein